MAEANVIVVLLVSTIVGGIVGVALGDVLSGLSLAVAAGFLGVIAAAIARNNVMTRWNKAGPDDSGIPMVIIVFSVVASLAGSMTAMEITRDLTLRSGMIGILAGLISSVLMCMLMVTYHMNPDKRRNRM